MLHVALIRVSDLIDIVRFVMLRILDRHQKNLQKVPLLTSLTHQTRVECTVRVDNS